MKSKALISIIIPVFKVETFLPKCLDSILAQSYPQWECILVDDGSPDKSGKICDEYAAHDSRFKVIHKQNEGVSIARNTGLEYARGTYVCFIDSDDWVENSYLENLICSIPSDGVGVVINGVIEDSPNGSNVKTICNKVYISSEFHNIFQGCLINFWGFPVSKLYNLEVIKTNHICFPKKVRYCEDLIFFFKYWFYCDWIKFNDVADYHYIVLQNPNSLVNSYGSFESEYEGYKERLASLQDLVDKYKPSTEESFRSYKWCAYMLLRAILSMYAPKTRIVRSERLSNLKYKITDFDVSFANQYKFCLSVFERFILSMLRLKLYQLLDFILYFYLK